MAKKLGSVGNIGSTAVWLILILVVLGLGGFGALNLSSNVRSLGTVGDTQVPINRYVNQVRQDLQTLSQRAGQQISFTQARQFGIDQNALQSVIGQVALEDEAARIGLSVGDDRVRDEIQKIQAFQGLDGKFDAQAYSQILQRNNLSKAQFEGQVRAEAARTLLGRAVVLGVDMPKSYVDTLYQWRMQRRSFDWAELTEAGLDKQIPAPTEAQIKDWYDNHQDPYTQPEKKAITYAWITPALLSPTIPVDEAALHKLYEESANDYSQPERRLVERLVFPSMEAAQQAWDRLQSNQISFDDLVKERGLELSDIDMGDVPESDLGAAGPAVFALTEPGLVAPQQTDLGPAILRVNGILPATETPFEDVEDELKQTYSNDRATQQIASMTEKVNDDLAAGGTVEDLAKDGMTVGRIDYDPSQSEGIAGYKAFREAAAKVKDGDFPEAIRLDDGGLFAMRLDKVIPSAVDPLDQVRDQVIQDWTEDQVHQALAAKADALLPRLEAGEDAGSLGLSMNHETGITRDTRLADVPEALIPTAFGQAAGKASRIDGTSPTSVAIVVTRAVQPPDPDDANAANAHAQAEQQINQQLSNDLLQYYTRKIEQGRVHIDQNAVNAVNAQFN